MKTKITLIAGSLFLGLGLLSWNVTSSNTGSITVTALEESKPSSGALVGVSTSAENLEDSKYIYEGETNSSGVITFKSVAPGTYYVDAAKDDFYGEGKVTVTDTEARVSIRMSEEDGDDEGDED